MMRASASGSLAFWMAGVVLAAATGGAWFAGRSFLPQDAAGPVPAVSSREARSDPGPSQDAQGAADTATDRAESAAAAATDMSGPKPRLDEVRHETDGLVVIAGRVAPFADVILRLDGSEFARASADGSGAFATVAMLAPSDAARVLTLSQFDGSGGEIDADDELILAPVRAPAAEDRNVARAGPDTAGAAIDAAAEDPAEEGSDMLVAALDRSAPREDEATGSEGADAGDPDRLVDSELASRSPTGDVARPAVGEAGTPDLATQTIAAEPLPTADLRAAPGEAPARADTATEVRRLEVEAVAVTRESGTARDTSPATAARAATDAGALAETTSADAVANTLPSQDAEHETAEAIRPGDGQQLAILRSNEEGVSVVRPVERHPQVTRQVALDSISYSDAGDVELQGRAQDAARQVRVYLDNRPVASLDVTAAGNWRGFLPAVDTGVYTLRIDEVDAAGRVTSRVETPFKREAPEVLAAATASVTAQVSAITVQRGDTLWAISRERYGDGILYVRVFEANRDSIRDPDLIYPGQIFALPAD